MHERKESLEEALPWGRAGGVGGTPKTTRTFRFKGSFARNTGKIKSEGFGPMPNIFVLLVTLLMFGCAENPPKPPPISPEIMIAEACGDAYDRYQATQECAEVDNCMLNPTDIAQLRADERFIHFYCIAEPETPSGH